MLATLACTTADLQQEEPRVRSEFEHASIPCEAFEVLDFGTKIAAALRGYVYVGDSEDPFPLPGARVTARESSTGRVLYDVVDDQGRYELSDLPPGRHEVWSCVDGFDIVTFTLVVDPSVREDRVDIFLRPSESSGVSRVVIQ
jgi:hypothetical protein